MITASDRARYSDIRAIVEQGHAPNAEDLAWFKKMRDPMRQVAHQAWRRTCLWQDYRLTGRTRRQMMEYMA